jgi:hypothetical protein
MILTQESGAVAISSSFPQSHGKLLLMPTSSAVLSPKTDHLVQLGHVAKATL